MNLNLNGRSNKVSLSMMMSWTAVVLETIGDKGASGAQIRVAVSAAITSGRLRCISTKAAHLKHTFDRLQGRGRISYNRTTKVWSKS